MQFSIASVALFTLAAAQSSSSKAKKTVYKTITSCTGECTLLPTAGLLGKNHTGYGNATANATIPATLTIVNTTTSLNSTIAPSTTAVSSTRVANQTTVARSTSAAVATIVPTAAGSATAEKANMGTLNTVGAVVVGAAVMAALL
ncbi:hypothetical protein CJU90_2274 [Yarrowia sp. C11]|nr:hypothetical protein CKK34_6302 [Yarrowia sp. E02]KAG5372192.1 hypothetical protein CJU90_2274 [Yarrowia sp. C11]